MGPERGGGGGGGGLGRAGRGGGGRAGAAEGGGGRRAIADSDERGATEYARQAAAALERVRG